MKCDTPFEKYYDLCDLFNEIFKTGSWGDTYMTYKHLWNEFWGIERSKFGILGEKGLKPEIF